MASVLQGLLPGPAAGSAAAAADAPTEDPPQGPPGKRQGRFGAALRAGAWPTGPPSAETSLEAVCAAAEALMAHWSVLPDGAAPVRRPLWLPSFAMACPCVRWILERKGGRCRCQCLRTRTRDPQPDCRHALVLQSREYAVAGIIATPMPCQESLLVPPAPGTSRGPCRSRAYRVVYVKPQPAVHEGRRWRADATDGAVAALCHIHTQRNKPPCLDTTPLSAAALLDHLRAGANYERQIVHVERLPARAARCGVLPFELHPPVRAALGRLGITPPQLFCHQVEAIVALLQQRHVAVCTSTASGKSLCYVVPILQVRMHARHACSCAACVQTRSTPHMHPLPDSLAWTVLMGH